MISDISITFSAGAKKIWRICQDAEINGFLNFPRVRWHFILKRAPWLGGFYRRLVGITKNVLKKILGRALVTLDERVTVVTEIESIVNERPITYVSSETEGPTALTPSMLLCVRPISLLSHDSTEVAMGDIQDPDFIIQRNMEQQSKRLDMLFQTFWCKWRSTSYE